VIVTVAQRWNRGRSSYRPVGEPIRTAEFSVESIPDDTTAKAFVLEHHYSGSFPSARERFGLYKTHNRYAPRCAGDIEQRRSDLVGVAVFSTPQNQRALDVLPDGRESGIELGRFILLDEVGANAETWFLARCFEQLRRLGYTGVVSFSDPVARRGADGDLVFPGHVGTIYQAHNAVYLGTTKPERKRLLADGTVIPGRTLAKIRKRDQGWRYSVERLVSYGAETLGDDEDSRVWLARWLSKLTTPLRHTGNHKYAWALLPRDRRRLPISRPYPKLDLGQLQIAIP
jgi:hypothetical protein